MDKQAILQFADLLKWEFFRRLKDETQPAEKEFSYVDLLNILKAVYKQAGISDADIAKYEKAKPNDMDRVLAGLSPEFRQVFEKIVDRKENK